MAQSLGLAGGADAAAALPTFTLQRKLDRRAAHSPATDWDLARLAKANLIVIGTDWMVSNLIASMWPHFDGPVAVRHRNERLWLPRAAERLGTIVLHDVDSLTREEQRALYEWLDRQDGTTRIISTASRRLAQRVEQGAFDDRLYYRLNTICVDLLGD